MKPSTTPTPLILKHMFIRFRVTEWGQRIYDICISSIRLVLLFGQPYGSRMLAHPSGHRNRRGAQCGAKFASNEALKSVSYPIHAATLAKPCDTGGHAKWPMRFLRAWSFLDSASAKWSAETAEVVGSLVKGSFGRTSHHMMIAMTMKYSKD